jgi:hypothetical protein
MQNCSLSVALIINSDKFNKFQCPKNNLERAQMKQISYASVVRSLMYAQVCTRPDITLSLACLAGIKQIREWAI